jgi:hypothetical protein
MPLEITLLAVLFFVAIVGVVWCLRGVQKDGEHNTEKIYALTREHERMNEKIRDLEGRLEKPSPLPHKTRDELEHAMAALMVIEREFNFGKDLVDNVWAHLNKARHPKEK